ncbi:MAG: hypothetical protein K8T91_27105 [Planctomycetes bacterium]|nr:hypothetical protein [Planctomycetota bacterium]
MVACRCFRRIGLGLAVLAGLVIFSPRLAQARTWTDQKGHTIEAKFVRVSGNEVVLEKGFKVIRVRLDQLSEADRQYVQKQLEADGLRIWTDVHGKPLSARLLRMVEGKVELREQDQKIQIPFAKLSYDDQEFVRKWFDERGQGDQVPKPDDKSRVWTDSAGKKVMASLRSVQQGGRLRLRSYGLDIRLTYDALSSADQDQLREQLQAEGKEDLLLAVRPPTEVATNNPPMAPTPVAPPPPPPAVPHCPRCGAAMGSGELVCSACEARDLAAQRAAATPPPQPVVQNPPPAVSAPMTEGERLLYTRSVSCLGMSLVVVGNIWIASIAFRNGNPIMGVLCLPCALVALVYGLMHPDEGLGPVGIQVVGVIIQIAGAVLFAV